MDQQWWRHAVVYQIYPRSFADADGDGLGDVPGLLTRLPYLADLAVDAIWISPWYPSPMADGGYDVADYRDVHPALGTLADADALIAQAHRHDIRVLLDVVPNHTSDQHPWFRQAVAEGPGSPMRERYLFRSGRGPDGDLPPNNWESVFGGPAWTRVTEPDGSPGEWYLHLFAPEQPDLDWRSDAVRADFEQTLRFWFDRGVDGFRIDVAHSLTKAEDLPDLSPEEREQRAGDGREHPHWDRDDVHEVYRRWRTIADSYDPPRVFVAEAWVDTPQRLARYVRPDELHNAFNFEILNARWQAESLREAVEGALAEQQAVGAPATWVLSNHDVARHVSRYARDQALIEGHDAEHLVGLPADLDLGTRRARAAILLLLALPGSVYLYQGEELGLPEVEDLPDEVREDPVWFRSEGTRLGRDGCRVPLPWTATGSSFGFGPDGGADPWLPQPPWWGAYAAAVQAGDPASMLTLYREALRIRRDHKAFGDPTMTWQESEADVLRFTRPDGLECIVNLGADPVPMPSGRVILASGPLDGGLPSDTAAWLRPG
jgi:alpha-glucosidase